METDSFLTQIPSDCCKKIPLRALLKNISFETIPNPSPLYLWDLLNRVEVELLLFNVEPRFIYKYPLHFAYQVLLNSLDHLLDAESLYIQTQVLDPQELNPGCCCAVNPAWTAFFGGE